MYSAVLAHFILKERLHNLGILGCVMCIAGSMVIVIHAPQERPITSVQEIWQKATQSCKGCPFFLLCCVPWFVLFIYFFFHWWHSIVMTSNCLALLFRSFSSLCCLSYHAGFCAGFPLFSSLWPFQCVDIHGHLFFNGLSFSKFLRSYSSFASCIFGSGWYIQWVIKNLMQLRLLLSYIKF